jgi:PAS domain S-box-containing protein
MNIFDHIYINFFATGALIATLFNIAVVLYFFIIPKKAKATTVMILIYFFIMIQNTGYLLTSSFYHPLSAFHRWLTVFSVIPGLIYIVQFFFYFPEERNVRTARIILAVQWIISLAVDAVFVIKSLEARTIFRFDGHYWDFDLDPLSYLISIIIICYILACIIAGIWRFIVTPKPGNKHVLFMLACFMVISVVPGITNALSREGTITRDIFQVSWNLVTVLGFFLAITVYTNVTRNRTTIMANIVGISMVAFLVVFQGLSYYTSREREEAYDMIQKQKLARCILDPTYRPADLKYLVRYSGPDNKSGQEFTGDVLPIRSNIRYDLANTLMYERLSAVPDGDFAGNLSRLLSSSHPYFTGYRSAIKEYAGPLRPGMAKSKRAIMNYIDRLNKITTYHRFKIKELGRENFRNDLRVYLADTNRSFETFKQVILGSMESNRQEGEDLRGEVMKFLAPMEAAGIRLYRLGLGDEHFVSYQAADAGAGSIYEAGFSYFSYRAFIHNSSIKLVYLLASVIILVMVGFPMFFRGALVNPLHDLLKGVRRVDEGNLEASVPVKMEDEIGFLADAFNKMMASVRDSNEKIDHINHYLKNIIDSMPSVVVGVDAEGKITHWNMAAEKMTGRREDEVMGFYLGEVYPRLSQYMDRMRIAITRKEPQKLEKLVQREKNETTYSDLLIYPLIADGVEGAVIRIDDVTSRVRLEEMMIQTEKMMSVGGLAAGMAHEINNPLSGILLAAQNIQRRLSPDNRINTGAAQETGVDFKKMLVYLEKRDIPRMIDGIREMGERASKIVNNMLNFSRRSESRSDMVNMQDLLDKTIELAASDYDLKKSYDFRHIEIIRDFEKGMPPVECVAVEIQQVILNLVRNAAHAIRGKKYPEGENPRITVRLWKEGESAHIEVEDNGPGMSDDLKKHIFEPFFTTKESGAGTGLGLSVSYFIITNNHHGTIAVDSLQDRGTTFTIMLPIKRERERERA